MPELTKENQAVLDQIYQANYPEGKTSIATDGHNICWSSSLLNRFFNTWASNPVQVFGNGTEGYSISNHSRGHGLNCPSGIVIKKNVIYVSDKNNHCIRAFGGDTVHSIYHGHPTNPDHSSIYPEKIILSNNTLFYMDGKNVNYLGSSKNVIEPYKIYSSDSNESVGMAVSICQNLQQNKISILVKV